MLGSLAGGSLNDKIGRRRTLGLSSFSSAIGVAVMFTSYLPASLTGRRVAFLTGKFLQGSAIGAVMAATQTYMSEILPPVLRGSGMAFFPAFTLLGQLTGALVIYGALGKEKGYTVAFASQWPFSFVPMCVAFFIPESPTWFVRKRRVDDAVRAQARLDPEGVDAGGVVERLVADIAAEERLGSATYVECFKKGNLRRTAIVMWSQSLTAVFGLQLLAKASYFLQLIDMKPGTSIIFLILGIVLGLIANVISIWVMARVGRRVLVVSGLVVASGLWLSMGIANCTRIVPAVTWYASIQTRDPVADDDIRWTAASMMLTIFICGLSVWPASFAIAAETSSLQLRAKAQGIGWFTSALATTVSGLALPYVFNPDEGNLRGKTGFTYAASCLLGAAVSWYLVPEMKGRSVAEINQMFEEGVPARQFKRCKVEGEVRVSA
jgi:MFS family permease